jgi:nitrous oxidase accessory protein
MTRRRGRERLVRAVLSAAWVVLAASGAAANADAPTPIQPLIDATPPGGVLRPSPGTYAGPAVVRHAMRLEGGGNVTIDGLGRGTVLSIEASGVVASGLRLVHSGTSHDTVDAGVRLQGSGNVIEDNRIEDCLFGVDLAQSTYNLVRHNVIHSKALDMGVRGDAIRLWYSFNNGILDNEISDVRDLVIWYSADNLIRNNRIRRARYALHTMYANRNFIEDNDLRDNMTGIFLMYSDGVEIRRNRIQGAQGATGMGVGFKESSNVVVEDNAIIYCAKGIYLDISPYEPDTTNRFERNRFAYNGVGVVFHTDWTGNEFRDNEFTGNFLTASVRGGGTAMRNVWERNYFDDYEGFDRDDNGTGDTPYELRAYADRIWMEIDAAQFFRSSLLLEMIDFLDRLAPFSSPILVMRDSSPRFVRPPETSS